MKVLEFTFDKSSCEPCFLDRSVRHKLNGEFVTRRLDVAGCFISAEFADEWRVLLMAVANLQIIVHTVVMVFYLMFMRQRTMANVESFFL